MRDEVIELKTFVKWVRRVIITGMVFVMVIYGVSYMMAAPQLGQGHYIKLYDQSEKLFYQSNQQSNDIALKDVSKDFLASIVELKIIVFILIEVLTQLVFYVQLRRMFLKVENQKVQVRLHNNMLD